MTRKISVSLLGYLNNFEKHKDTILSFTKNRGILHIDIMRESYIKDTNEFSIDQIIKLNEFLNENASKNNRYQPLDYHLMIKNPRKTINIINKITRNKKESFITIHREAFNGNTTYITKTLKLINEYRFKSGIALEPNTPINSLTLDMINNSNLILLMSVKSGLGGQEYMPQITQKIIDASKIPCKIIEVDGGIKNTNINEIYQAKANMYVVGSYITKSNQPLKKFIELRKIVKG